MPISITNKDEALALVTSWLSEPASKRQARIITTPNPEMIVAAQTDREFLAALCQADLSIPDGWGIIWALRTLNFKFDILNFKFNRVSGLQLTESLVGEAAHRGWKIMLLGGKPGIAAAAAQVLLQNIAALSGPSDITSASPGELDRLAAQINRFRPDILFVAFGHGKQEKWMAANRNRLRVGVMMGVGGVLDQLADPSLRPPFYIDSIGLGWLYRLIRQPWRWRRQLALAKFVGMVVRNKL